MVPCFPTTFIEVEFLINLVVSGQQRGPLGKEVVTKESLYYYLRDKGGLRGNLRKLGGPKPAERLYSWPKGGLGVKFPRGKWEDLR